MAHLPKIVGTKFYNWTSIGGGFQFYQCRGLTNVVFDAPYITVMPGRAFGSCSALTNLTLNAPLITTFGQACFYGVPMTNDVATIIPKGARDIGINAFTSCGVTGDLVLTNLWIIRSQAFSYAKRITSVDITADDTRTITDSLLQSHAFLEMGACTSIVVRSSTVTNLSAMELFKNCYELKRVELDFPALTTLDKSNASQGMFMQAGIVGLELTLTASNLVTIGTSLNLTHMRKATLLGKCPGAEAMTNLFNGIGTDYSCTLHAPKQAQFGWRRQVSALTSDEKTLESCPAGVYGTWTNGKGKKIWVAHVESPYYEPLGLMLVIR